MSKQLGLTEAEFEQLNNKATDQVDKEAALHWDKMYSESHLKYYSVNQTAEVNNKRENDISVKGSQEAPDARPLAGPAQEGQAKDHAIHK